MRFNLFVFLLNVVFLLFFSTFFRRSCFYFNDFIAVFVHRRKFIVIKIGRIFNICRKCALIFESGFFGFFFLLFSYWTTIFKIFKKDSNSVLLSSKTFLALGYNFIHCLNVFLEFENFVNIFMSIPIADFVSFFIIPRYLSIIYLPP